MATLTGNKIKRTYYKLVQVNGNNELQDGLGNLLTGSLGLSGSLILSGSQTIGGNLVVGGNVTAQQFIATTVSSSIIYESGSSAFGNSLDDTHTFTGSLLLEGSQSISGPLSLGVITDVSSSIDSITNSVVELSGSAHIQRTALISTLSGSAHTARRSEILDLSGSSYSSRIALIEALSSSVDTHLDLNILALSSSAHTSRRSEISDLSGSAHIQRSAISASLASSIASNTSDVGILSSSAHIQRVAMSASLKTYTDSKVSDLVNGAPELLDTLNELAAALGDDPAISASFASTLGTKASITQLNNSSSAILSEIDNLSGSAHIQRNATIEVLSGSAHLQREAIVSELSASIETTLQSYNAPTATSASYALTASYALNVPVTASYSVTSSFAENAAFAVTASHALNVPATASYAVSSSYAVTASYALNVSEGTGFPFTGSAIITGSLEVIGGTITGDGSGLTNVGIDAQTSYFQAFTNSSTLNVNHGLSSKNVIVTVYNALDELIVPASITTSDSNTAIVTFDSSTSGRVGVTRGGHIVSASSLMTLTPIHPLPTDAPTGSLAVSGSIAKLYFYNGNSANGWNEIAFV